MGLYRGWFDWSRRYSGCVSCACHVRIRFIHAYDYVREYTCCWCLWKNECSISRVQLLFSLSEPGHVFLSCCIFCSCLFSRLFSFFPYFPLIVFLYLFSFFQSFCFCIFTRASSQLFVQTLAPRRTRRRRAEGFLRGRWETRREDTWINAALGVLCFIPCFFYSLPFSFFVVIECVVLKITMLWNLATEVSYTMFVRSIEN